MEINKQNIIKVFKHIKKLKEENNYKLFYINEVVDEIRFDENEIVFTNTEGFVVLAYINFKREIIYCFQSDKESDYNDCDTFVHFLDQFKFYQKNNIIDEISEKVGSYEPEIKL